MKTVFDAPPEALDHEERSFVATVRVHGWFRTGVFADADRPSFSYTTGLWVNIQKPEITMFSLRDETAHKVFWDLFRLAQAGQDLPMGMRTYEVFANVAAYIFPVAKRHYRNYLGWSRWFYADDDFPCVQVVWPNRAGRFPWEQGFDPAFAYDQPDLTENGWLAALAN